MDLSCAYWVPLPDGLRTGCLEKHPIDIWTNSKASCQDIVLYLFIRRSFNPVCLIAFWGTFIRRWKEGTAIELELFMLLADNSGKLDVKAGTYLDNE